VTKFYKEVPNVFRSSVSNFLRISVFVSTILRWLIHILANLWTLIEAKGKIVLVCDSKAYGGVESTALLIPNFDTRWVWVITFTPRQRHPLGERLLETRDWWTPESIRMLRRKEKCLSSTVNRNLFLGCPTDSVVAILTTPVLYPYIFTCLVQTWKVASPVQDAKRRSIQCWEQ
jgi:hypothetical protein